MLRQVVLSHLEQYPVKGTLLLGLSGGPDSMALFHILKENHIPFEVAHYQHGWREEGEKEAQVIERICYEARLPFHTEKASFLPQKNLEDEGRKQRQAFFKKVTESKDFDGVVLGHHADDQAETVLKRVLEGARMTRLTGLRPVSTMQGLTFHRPLLPVRKQEILLWMEEHKYAFFEDHTNQDQRFLRGRMRQKILPDLSRQFGKEVIPNLLKLASRSYELEMFIDAQLQPFISTFSSHQTLFQCDAEALLKLSSFLYPLGIRAFFDYCCKSQSENVIQTILTHIKKKSKRIELKVTQGMIRIDFPIISLEKLL